MILREIKIMRLLKGHKNVSIIHSRQNIDCKFVLYIDYWIKNNNETKEREEVWFNKPGDGVLRLESDELDSVQHRCHDTRPYSLLHLQHHQGSCLHSFERGDTPWFEDTEYID